LRRIAGIVALLRRVAALLRIVALLRRVAALLRIVALLRRVAALLRIVALLRRIAALLRIVALLRRVAALLRIVALLRRVAALLRIVALLRRIAALLRIVALRRIAALLWELLWCVAAGPWRLIGGGTMSTPQRDLLYKQHDTACNDSKSGYNHQDTQGNRGWSTAIVQYNDVTALLIHGACYCVVVRA
jgi:hypothetical protein